MFDFISMELPGKYSETLLNNKSLDFETSLNNQTGEIRKTETGYLCHRAKYLEFDIHVWVHHYKPHRVEIKGSFHKLHERGKNWNDFTFQDFNQSVLFYSNTLGIEPFNFTIHGIEIGVNITPPIDTTLLIEGIKSFNGLKFDRDSFSGNGLMMSVPYTNHRIKVYDKFRQYANNLDAPNYPILRIELKVLKMAYLQCKGVNITTLQDLISGEWNAAFLKLLIKQLDKIVICPEGMADPRRIDNIRSRTNFINGLNPDYWPTLSNRAFKRQSQAFRNQFIKLTGCDLHSDLKSRILQKWLKLCEPEKGQMVKYYPYIDSNKRPYTVTHTREQRFCKTCGRDITHRPGTIFCSAKDVGEQAAHRCRNRDSNPRYAAKAKEQRRRARELRLYPDLTLFPVHVHW